MRQVSEKDYERVISFLKSCRAHQIAHVNGYLLAHLEGTFNLLNVWGNTAELCLAGLCHTVYGTDGFEARFLDISQRRELSNLIGPKAERLVYFYASCDRSHLYPQIGHALPVRFRDRFNGSIFTPEDWLFKAFLELTFANELEILRSDAALLEKSRASLEPLFAHCRRHVSDSAFACFLRLYGTRLELPDPDLSAAC